MDQETLSQLLAAIQGKEWYAVVGLGLMVAIAVARVVAPTVWDKIPTRFQWVPAVLGAGAVAAVDAWQSGLPWLQAVVLAVFAMVSAAPIAVGSWHIVKRITGGAADKSTVVTAKKHTWTVGKSETDAVSSPYDPTEKHPASDPPEAA